jgi:peptide/nickel transport system substrate-binding protein
MVYDSLIMRDYVNFAPEPPRMPGLAERWEVGPEGMSYTFFLRKGVKFHDGTPFDAAAVKFNFDRDSDPSHPNYFQLGAGAAKAILGKVKSTEVVDPYTFKVNMKEPEVLFLNLIEGFFIVSPEVVKKFGNDNYPRNTAGTGAFKFVKHESGVEAVLEKNPDYWNKEWLGGGPFVDKIVIRFIPEATARVAALQAKEVDWIVAVPPDSVPALQKDSNVVVSMESIPHTWMWRMNFKNEHFMIKKVRQAVALGIDREKMAKGLLRDTAVAAAQFWAPGSPGYRATPKEMTYSYDPERAKALVKEAGFPSGIDVKVFVPNSGSGMMVPVPMNESIQEDLAKVGIRVKFEIVEWQAYLSRSAAGMPPEYAAFGTSLGTEDFSSLPRQFHSKYQPPNGGNPQWYVNPEVDKVFDDAAKTLDDAKRTELYQKANDLITEDVVFLNVVHDKAPMAWNKTVNGFQHTKSWSFSFTKTWLNK